MLRAGQSAKRLAAGQLADGLHHEADTHVARLMLGRSASKRFANWLNGKNGSALAYKTLLWIMREPRALIRCFACWQS